MKRICLFLTAVFAFLPCGNMVCLADLVDPGIVPGTDSSSNKLVIGIGIAVIIIIAVIILAAVKKAKAKKDNNGED